MKISKTAKQTHIRIPSKTFILGEYAVLDSGTAIVMAHEPAFSITISEDTCFTSNFPHAALNARLKQCGNFHWELTDPHQGQGGFGLSSALALCHAHFLNPKDPLAPALDINRQFSPRSSGADVISQYHGGLSSITPSAVSSKVMTMPRLGFIIVRTGLKEPTHTHLATLPNLSFTNLQKCVDAVIDDGHPQSWVMAINNCESQLQDMQLRALEVIPLIKAIQSHPKILAAKGCGALGADVILAVCEIENMQTVQQDLGEEFDIITTNNGIIHGA